MSDLSSPVPSRAVIKADSRCIKSSYSDDSIGGAADAAADIDIETGSL
jgi:hypothetical protein